VQQKEFKKQNRLASITQKQDDYWGFQISDFKFQISRISDLEPQI
jgi:hypothetical protein